MRTLFCSHSNGVLIPPTPSATSGTSARAPASLGAKHAGQCHRPGAAPVVPQQRPPAPDRSNPKNGAPK